MVKRIRESDEGFSLVELLLVLALLGLVLSLGFTAYALGTKMYSRSADQAMVQQQERYLIEYFPRELRYAYDVKLFASLNEVPELVEGQTILYSDPQGIWQRQGESEARLVISAEQVTYDIAFSDKEGTGTLVVGYRVGLNKTSPEDDYKEVSVRLLNAELDHDVFSDTWARVMRYVKPSQ
jgi:prepilin-type N-terminal cleavage/methylation domain-containing protein